MDKKSQPTNEHDEIDYQVIGSMARITEGFLYALTHRSPSPIVGMEIYRGGTTEENPPWRLKITLEDGRVWPPEENRPNE